MKKVLILISLGFLLASCYLFHLGEEESVAGDNPIVIVRPVLPTQIEVPFKTSKDYLMFWDYNDKKYKDILVKGMNLGVGKPGTAAGELAATYEDYMNWLAQMHEMGINVLRIYTLHFPRFYQAVNDFNYYHPDNPIYIMHGVWLREEKFEGQHSLLDKTEEFQSAMKEVVDSVYGNKSIDKRPGEAYGNFSEDISRWIMAWIIGREIHPAEVREVNNAKTVTSYSGIYFDIKDTDTMSVWTTEQLDFLMDYEYKSYKYKRPVSMSSWPTLDSLTHPTEAFLDSDEDKESIDFEKIEIKETSAGLFASYHAYPYYPDFINDDPNYQTYQDDKGYNSYVGYLTELKAVYKDIPLLIAEFGVPSSWGNAHDSHSGMNHGGFDEKEQGEANARIFDNIYTTNCAGGAVFAWIDEWWKQAWINNEITNPNTRALWHDITNPEQNYGMIAFESVKGTYSNLNISENNSISSIKALADMKVLHLEIELKENLEIGDEFIIGFDTYKENLGNGILPNGSSVSKGVEMALSLSYPSNLQMYVTKSYDLYGISLNKPRKLYHPEALAEEEWEKFQWMNRDERTMDGVYEEAQTQEIGNMGISFEGDEISSKDGLIISDKKLKFEIPWVLLQFRDPANLEIVFNDAELTEDGEWIDRDTKLISGEKTDGINFYFSIKGELIETSKYTWDSWTYYPLPAYTDRLKASYYSFKEALAKYPNIIE